MDPKGKAPAPTPLYHRDAQKGYLPSVPFPHAGPEPSGQARRSFLKGNSLDQEDHVLPLGEFSLFVKKTISESNSKTVSL